MGRFALIIVATLSLTYAVSNLNLNNLLNIGVENSANIYSRSRARNIGQSMTNILKTQLSVNRNWREASPVSTTLMNANIDYTIKDTVLNYTDSLVIIKVNTDYFDCIHKTIEYVKVPSTAGEVDEFLQYAVIGKNVQITGGKGNVYVQPHNSFSINANVHANGSTSDGDEGHFRIMGFLTHVDLNGISSLDVNPNYNPENKPKIKQIEIINVPTIIPSNYLSSADSVYSTKTYSGTISLGTKESPKIIYATGAITFNNCTISGYGIFICESDFYINGTMAFSDPSLDKVALYGSGNCEIGPSNILYGQVVVNGTITISKNAKVYGNIAAGSDIYFSEEETIAYVYYKPASADLSAPLGFGKVGSSNPGRVKTVWVYE